MARELVKTISRGKRNLLINGDFQIAQRGVQLAATGSGIYLLDRWQAWTSSAGSVSSAVQIQSSLPAGFPGVFNQTGLGQGTCHRLYADVDDFTQSSSFLRRQRVESIKLKDGVRTISKVSAGAWVYANNMQTATIQIFTADVKDNFGAISLENQNTVAISDNTWTYVSVEDVDLSNSNGIEIRVSVGSPAANVFTDTYVAEVMLNEGPTVEPFRLMGDDFAQELQHCQRYYEKSYQLAQAVGTSAPGALGANYFTSANGSVGGTVLYVPFKVRKRGLPNCVVYNTDGTLNEFRNVTALTDISAGTTVESEAGFYARNVGATTTGHVHAFQWSANAEL